MLLPNPWDLEESRNPFPSILLPNPWDLEESRNPFPSMLLPNPWNRDACVEAQRLETLLAGRQTELGGSTEVALSGDEVGYPR